MHLDGTLGAIPAWPQVACSLYYGLSQAVVKGPFEEVTTELGSQGIGLHLSAT